MIKENNKVKEYKANVEQNMKNYYMQMNNLMHLMVSFMFIVTIIGAFIRVKEGSTTKSYLISAIVIFIVTEILAKIFINKNPNSTSVGYVLFGGYATVYILSLFTSATIMTVITAFPILVALIIYRDRLLSIVANVTICVFIAIFLLMNYKNLVKVDISILLGNIIMFMPINLMVNSVMSKIWDGAKQSIDDANNKNEELENVLSEVTNLSGIVTQTSNNLNNMVSDLGGSTTLVNKSIEEISHGATKTSKVLEGETIILSEMTSKIYEASNATKKVKNQSEVTESAIKYGLESVNLLNEKSVYISNKNNKVSDSIKELAEKSNNIASITNIITQLANQTNLLALNASIEAARVGEAGKGFAIVAEEIKNLSEASRENVENIENILTELQKETSSSVLQVEELLKETCEQQKLVNNTDTAFNNISESMNIVKKEIEDVLVRMEDVLTNSQKIQDDILDISEISEETMSNAEESNNISEDNLNKLKDVRNILDDLSIAVNNMEKVFDK